MKRIISLIMAGTLVFGSTTAYAQSEPKFITEYGESEHQNGDTFVQDNIMYEVLKDGTLYAFDIYERRSEYKEVVIPETVNGKTITKVCFNYCPNLSSISMPDSVVEIEFIKCTSLTSIVVPRGVTRIDGDFYGCSSLASVSIPDTVISIGDDSFKKCTSLTSVTIPKSVKYFSDFVFDDCTSLTEINVDENNEIFCSLNSVMFTKDKTELIKYPTGNISEYYNIPNGVTTINYGAFEDCPKLKEIKIPNSVTRIEDRAFAYTCLTSLTLPNSVTTLDAQIFMGCTKLASITIPESVTYLDGYVFDDCTGLSEINVDADNKNYCSVNGIVFNKDKTQLIRYPIGKKAKSYIIPNGIKLIGLNSFCGCVNLSSVTIPNTTTDIRGGAFERTGIKSIVIPDSVTYIGGGTFRGCTNLATIAISNGITKIEIGTFSECINLTSVVIPSSVEKIDLNVFSGCTNLTSITIPDSVTSIGYFEKCKNLKDIYFGGSKEQWDSLQVSEYSINHATVHYNSTGPVGVDVTVEIKAPEGTDISDQSATTTVNGETKPLAITDGKLDLSGIPDGEYTFTFKANNCAPRDYKVTVSGGAATGLEDGVELHLYGDINGDGKINTTDILKAKLQTKGSNKLDGYDLAVADANKDGKVNGTDVLKLKLHAKGSTKLW